MSVKLAIISTNKSQYSETFIHSHINLLPFEILVYSNGYLPTEYSFDNGRSFTPVPNTTSWILKKKSPLKNLKKSFLKNQINSVLAEYGPSGVEVFPLCHELNIPLIVHFHGYDAYRDDILQTYGQKYRDLFTAAQAIICVSKDMKMQLTDLGCPPDKLHLIPYGIDTTLFRPDNKVESQFGHFVSCGRFVAKKAPQATIKAFYEVQKKFPEARLTMIGDGELLQECKELSRQLELTEKIEFAGILTQSEIIKRYQGAFAFLQHSVRTPNNDSEGAPLAIMEASATGLPVISTFHAGIPEIVADNQTGLLVPENDIDAMSRKMLELLYDPKMAQNLGKNGNNKIINEFHRDGYICKLNELIEKVIAENSNFN